VSRLAAVGLAALCSLALAAPAAATPPANNDFAGQTLTGASPAFTGTNVDANGQVGEDNHAIASRDDSCDETDLSCITSVWWSWTAPSSGLVNVNLCRSSYDTTLGVYVGDSVGALTEVASNDDIDPTEDDADGETTSGLNCPSNRTASGVEFAAVAGETYRIAVAGFAGATGAIDGRISGGPLGTLPPNPGRCSNRSLGSDGRDDLAGTAFGDVIGGLDGNDRLRGGRGDDCLYGDRGRDRIDGGSGRDRVFGNSGNDRVNGGTGNDRVGGNSGNDRVTGGRGNDVVSGGAGNDAISVRDGRRDRVNCGRGRDRVRADRRDRLRGCERVRRR
jgi:Ca2+-binding RTX toxin-like protein